MMDPRLFIYFIVSILGISHSAIALRGYLRAEEIGRTILEPISTYGYDNCDKIALAIMRAADPGDQFDTTSEVVKERMRNAIRMIKDTAIHTHQLGYIRQFNSCLRVMHEPTAPTGQYLLFDEEIEHDDYPEFNGYGIDAHLEDPARHPKPRFLQDYIDYHDVERVLDRIVFDQTNLGCYELAYRLLEISNLGTEINLQARGMRARIQRILELAMLSLVWKRNFQIIPTIHGCLSRVGARALPLEFYRLLNSDESRI